MLDIEVVNKVVENSDGVERRRWYVFMLRLTAEGAILPVTDVPVQLCLSGRTFGSAGSVTLGPDEWLLCGEAEDIRDTMSDLSDAETFSTTFRVVMYNSVGERFVVSEHVYGAVDEGGMMPFWVRRA
jgi:hypothetical protein